MLFFTYSGCFYLSSSIHIFSSQEQITGCHQFALQKIVNQNLVERDENLVLYQCVIKIKTYEFFAIILLFDKCLIYLLLMIQSKHEECILLVSLASRLSIISWFFWLLLDCIIGMCTCSANHVLAYFHDHYMKWVLLVYNWVSATIWLHYNYCVYNHSYGYSRTTVCIIILLFTLLIDMLLNIFWVI